MVFKRNFNNCWRGDGWLRVQGHEASRCEVSAYLTSSILSFLFCCTTMWLVALGNCLATNTDISTFDSVTSLN
jgi:hypothetical protein